MTSSYLRDEAKNRVREAADIVQVIGEYVELKRTGSRFTGLCPFHAEKTPSFSVNPQRGFFHCFGCGESGDVFTFLMKYNRLSFPEALNELARRYHIDLPEPKLSDDDRKRIREREVLYRINEEAAKIFERCLADSPVAGKAREYLVQRGVPQEASRLFRLGYAPGPEAAGWSFVVSRLQELHFSIRDIERAGLAARNEHGGYYDRFRDRILFPIQDMTGRVVAFGGRILGDGKPKYMNSPESPIFDKSRLLFGLYPHRENIRAKRRALVVEGNFDLLMLAAHNCSNVVAPLGTALTGSHIRSLRGYCDEVVLLFDGDSAGLKAAMRSIPFFLAEQVDARIALLPEGHDPDTFVRAEGGEGINRLVEEAEPLAEFVFDYLVKQHGMTLQGKNHIVRELQEIMAACTEQLQRSLMIAHFSEKLGIPPGRFAAGLPEAGSGKSGRQSSADALGGLARQHRQLVDFLIYYPEFIDELLACGVREVISSPPVLDFIACLKRLAEEGAVSPDRLLAAFPGESPERRYVARLLMTGGQPGMEEDENRGRRMCDELTAWLRKEQRDRENAELMRRINEAQQSGDKELLMQLLRQKQALGRNY